MGQLSQLVRKGLGTLFNIETGAAAGFRLNLESADVGEMGRKGHRSDHMMEQEPERSSYSVRSVIVGWIRVARHAGT